MALVRVCDLHDLTEWWVEVAATRRFVLDGQHYEVDLCEEHDAALDQVLAPYLPAARPCDRPRYLTLRAGGKALWAAVSGPPGPNRGDASRTGGTPTRWRP